MTNINNTGSKMLKESKFFSGYSRWIEDKKRNETWEESVDRVMGMHRVKYNDLMSTELDNLICYADAAYKEQLVLGAQRALQFGGSSIFKHEAKMYNCATSYADRPSFFTECMYLLMCGCGVGFSVQKHHISNLPSIVKRRTNELAVFEIPDSIEGWADAFGVLLSSYWNSDATHPEYKGKQIKFDFSKIRPKGAHISGGFKAPGPDGLRKALIKCEDIIEKLLEDNKYNYDYLPSIAVYDLVMHMSDAVLSGGIRRSATICIFDIDDEDMLNAKTGDYFTNNPQRARSNNSVMAIKGEVTKAQWDNVISRIKDFGDPGFILSDSKEFIFNPCVEIGMMPITVNRVSGFQFCNLTEINGGMCDTTEIFLRACKAAAILGTLQAGYTNFNYLTNATKDITDKEALIGVGLTGWMNNPDVLLSASTLVTGAQVVKNINKQVAALLGINQAARTTCVKPSGNASVLLGTASGIHGEHSPMYFRNVQMNKEDEVTKLITEYNPEMVEDSVWSANGTDSVVSFPVVSKEGSVYKKALMGINQLEIVKFVQKYWVESGTNVELCSDPRLRNNVSNTISVDDWDKVGDYIYENKKSFAGIALLSSAGDRAYPQSPFTEVFTSEQILAMYGDGALLASGLIVDALHAFNDDLWQACSTVKGYGIKLSGHAKHLLMRDWVRRANKFSVNYFNNDIDLMISCIKDCYNLHKWRSIQRSIIDIDFVTQLKARKYTEVDTIGSEGCSGGTCDIN